MPLSLEIKTIPVITVEQMDIVEQLMIEDFGIQLNEIMEKAGIQLANLSHKFLKNIPEAKNVVVVAGNYKGAIAGMTAARHLNNLGFQVTVLAVGPNLENFPESAQNILEKSGSMVKKSSDSLQEIFNNRADLIVDALMVHDHLNEFSGQFDEMIDALNQSDARIISLDIPSGLDGTTGHPSEHCIRAMATLCLALPKAGLFLTHASPYVGSLYLADISVPHTLYQNLGISFAPIFQNESIISLSENSIEESFRVLSSEQISNQSCILLEED